MDGSPSLIDGGNMSVVKVKAGREGTSGGPGTGVGRRNKAAAQEIEKKEAAGG